MMSAIGAAQIGRCLNISREQDYTVMSAPSARPISTGRKAMLRLRAIPANVEVLLVVDRHEVIRHAVLHRIRHSSANLSI